MLFICCIDGSGTAKSFKKRCCEPASCMRGIAWEQNNELKMAQLPLLNISYFSGVCFATLILLIYTTFYFSFRIYIKIKLIN